MPRTQIQAGNTNLAELSNGGKRTAISEVIDEISDIEDVKRDKNNIIKGNSYRLDAKPMARTDNGIKAGDYKVDIQTVTRQKSHSVTVAIAYVDALAPDTSLADLKAALTDSLNNQNIDRVT